MWISDVPEHYVLARDPDDSMYLNLAIAAGAPFVVTDDLDLLDLMNLHSAAGIDFRNRFPVVQIATPTEFESHLVNANP
jgi:predicted nucleic acid-binding protein